MSSLEFEPTGALRQIKAEGQRKEGKLMPLHLFLFLLRACNSWANSMVRNIHIVFVAVRDSAKFEESLLNYLHRFGQGLRKLTRDSAEFQGL